MVINGMMNIDPPKDGEAGVTGFSDPALFVGKVPQPVLDKIWEEVNSIKESNFTSHQNVGDFLAGQIEKEFALQESFTVIEEMLQVPVNAMEQGIQYSSRMMNVNNRKRPLALGTAWVNFQKKHEWNPPHKHDGVYSFVIWLDIPFTVEEEQTVNPGRGANTQHNGGFSFIKNDPIQGVSCVTMPVDKKWNGVIAMFPASMVHMVAPFYSSDDYRISISGNVFYKVD
jgi:hypothetical protein